MGCYRPFCASFLSLAFIIIALIFPPKTYEYLMNEKDFMFLNSDVLLYSLLATTFFYIGTKFPVFFLGLEKSINNIEERVGINILFNIFSISFILLSFFWFILFTIAIKVKFGFSLFELLSYGYASIKYSNPFIPYKLGGIPTLLAFSSIFYSYLFFILPQKNKFKKLLFILVILIVFVENLITVNRNPLFITLFSIYFIYSYFYRKNFLKQMFKFFAILLILFSITVILRFGGGDWYSISQNILGYSISSVNRFAYQINFDVDLIGEFYRYKTNNKLYNIELWHQILAENNFNPFYNLPTFYYKIYRHWEWFGLPIFCLLGLITRYLFLLFIKRNIIGILFYPILYFSIILWFITDVFSSNLLYIIYSIIFIILLIFVANLLKKSNIRRK